MNDNLAYKPAVREELLAGRAVAMSPSPTVNHNRIAFNVAWLFRTHLDKKRCEVLADGTDLYLDEDNVFIPDMMVVCDPAKVRWNGVYGAPDLVVEVLSPGTAKHDRGYKKEAYQRCGVREYWIISPNEKTVEQYLLRDGTLQLQAVYPLYPDYVLESMEEEERAEVVHSFTCSLYDDFDIPLAEIFYRTT